MARSSFFSRTVMACVFLLGNTVLAKTTEGSLFVEGDDGKLNGCLNSKVQWVTDDTQCATFEAKDHEEHSIFSLGVNGAFCRVGTGARIICDLEDDDPTWQSTGDIRDESSYLLSDGWVAGGEDNWYARLVPGTGEAIPVSGSPRKGAQAVHIRLAWVPQDD